MFWCISPKNLSQLFCGSVPTAFVLWLHNHRWHRHCSVATSTTWLLSRWTFPACEVPWQPLLAARTTLPYWPRKGSFTPGAATPRDNSGLETGETRQEIYRPVPRSHHRYTSSLGGGQNRKRHSHLTSSLPNLTDASKKLVLLIDSNKTVSIF